MEFYDGFAWAVPLGFSDAVGLCRFEEGDLLYDSREAYEGVWSIGSNHVTAFLQVRYPSQSLARAAQNSTGVFETNWRSSATIDLFRNGEKTNDAPLPTTQGRIYTAIWKGDLDVLDPSTDEPFIPLSVTAATKRLNKVVLSASVRNESDRALVMARDRSNQISRTKFTDVVGVLQRCLASPPIFLSPREAGFEGWEDFAPTIDIAVLPIAGESSTDIESIVKSVTYKPSGKSTKDRYRLRAHGVIYEWSQLSLM